MLCRCLSYTICCHVVILWYTSLLYGIIDRSVPKPGLYRSMEGFPALQRYVICHVDSRQFENLLKFVGVGIAMFIVSAMVSVYYIMVVAWCLYYVINSLRLHVPWASCGNTWNTKGTRSSLLPEKAFLYIICFSVSACSELTRESIEECELKNMSMLRNGTCIDAAVLAASGSGNESTIELSQALTVGFRLNRTLPSEEYFQ